MKTIFSLIAIFTVSACGGLSSNPESGEPTPVQEWRFAQAWTAPLRAAHFEVCALDPDSLRVRKAGQEAPGVPCADVAAQETVELWVTPQAGPSPYHHSITVYP